MNDIKKNIEKKLDKLSSDIDESKEKLKEDIIDADIKSGTQKINRRKGKKSLGKEIAAQLDKQAVDAQKKYFNN